MAPKLQFPLSDQQDYKARVTFSAYTDYVTTLSDLELGAYNSVKDVVKGDRNFTDTVGQLFNNASDLIGSFVESFSGNLNKTYSSSVPVKQTDNGSVSLFLPNAIQIADGVVYSETSLGALGGSAAGALREGGTLGDAGRQVVAQIGQDVEALTDVLLGQNAAGAELVALRLLRAGGPLAGAVETETGIALNPNRRSALSGITIRRFNFQFKLIPNSYEESQEIKKIIKWFRTEMYPEPVGTISEQANVSLALRYPSKFKITMTYEGKKIATGILPCFLENFTATYNPTGMSFHKGGDFQEIDINMSFLEERPLTRKDVIED